VAYEKVKPTYQIVAYNISLTLIHVCECVCVWVYVCVSVCVCVCVYGVCVCVYVCVEMSIFYLAYILLWVNKIGNRNFGINTHERPLLGIKTKHMRL
jgi:hypothetical protein